MYTNSTCSICFVFFLVTVQPDPFPVLTPPRVPTDVTSPSQNNGMVHPVTQSMKATSLLLRLISYIQSKSNLQFAAHSIFDILLYPDISWNNTVCQCHTNSASSSDPAAACCSRTNVSDRLPWFGPLPTLQPRCHL